MKESLEVQVAKLDVKVEGVREDTHYLRGRFDDFVVAQQKKDEDINAKVAKNAALVGLIVTLLTSAIIKAIFH